LNHDRIWWALPLVYHFFLREGRNFTPAVLGVGSIQAYRRDRSSKYTPASPVLVSSVIDSDPLSIRSRPWAVDAFVTLLYVRPTISGGKFLAPQEFPPHRGGCGGSTDLPGMSTLELAAGLSPNDPLCVRSLLSLSRKGSSSGILTALLFSPGSVWTGRVILSAVDACRAGESAPFFPGGSHFFLIWNRTFFSPPPFEPPVYFRPKFAPRSSFWSYSGLFSGRIDLSDSVCTPRLRRVNTGLNDCIRGQRYIVIFPFWLFPGWSVCNAWSSFPLSGSTICPSARQIRVYQVWFFLNRKESEPLPPATFYAALFSGRAPVWPARRTAALSDFALWQQTQVPPGRNAGPNVFLFSQRGTGDYNSLPHFLRPSFPFRDRSTNYLFWLRDVFQFLDRERESPVAGFTFSFPPPGPAPRLRSVLIPSREEAPLFPVCTLALFLFPASKRCPRYFGKRSPASGS